VSDREPVRLGRAGDPEVRRLLELERRAHPPRSEAERARELKKIERAAAASRPWRPVVLGFAAVAAGLLVWVAIGRGVRDDSEWDAVDLQQSDELAVAPGTQYQNRAQRRGRQARPPRQGPPGVRTFTSRLPGTRSRSRLRTFASWWWARGSP